MQRNSLSRSIVLGTLTAAMFVSPLATGVYAQSPTGSSRQEERQERQQERVQNTLKRLQTRADTEIKHRIDRLTVLLKQIANSKLTQSQKDSLTSQVQTYITGLQTQGAKIDADADLATLRTDVKAIVNSFRVYAFFVPKMHIIEHADRLLDAANQMITLTTKLQAMITKASAAGKDVSKIQPLMDDRTAKLNDAVSQAQQAISTVLPLTADGYPGNMSVLSSARTMLRTALSDLRQAFKDAQQVRKLLRQLGKSPKPTP